MQVAPEHKIKLKTGSNDIKPARTVYFNKYLVYFSLSNSQMAVSDNTLLIPYEDSFASDLKANNNDLHHCKKYNGVMKGFMANKIIQIRHKKIQSIILLHSTNK